MIPLPRAIKIIQREAHRLGTERIEIEMAAGRFLAEEIRSDSDLPRFDRSQMDGYAVRAKDTLNAPARLRLVGESSAGKAWDGHLQLGEAVRIMTGARLPKGADAVQKLELSRESDGYVTIEEPVAKGKFVTRRGSEVKAGKICLQAGERLSAWNIAIPAAFGKQRIRVFRQPSVAIIPTGSEIVEIHRQPRRDCIRDSNSQMLASLCREIGAIPQILPIVGDDASKLVGAINEAIRQSDVVITTGGVSAGKYDLTARAFRRAGVEIFFDRVRLKPGKPVTFGRKGKTLLFGLPGNPVSAAVSFLLLVNPALLQMQGAPNRRRLSIPAMAAVEMKAADGRETYLPVKIDFTDEGVIATPIRWQGSGDFVAMAQAAALARIPAGQQIAAGGRVEIIPLGAK